jgi:membrane protein DedA with SNARE-associated domain
MEQWLEVVPPVLVYVIVGVVIGLESLGVPCPGEIVLVAAALMASQHDTLNPVWVGACAATGAIVGDSGGYLIGRTHGGRLFLWAGERFPTHLGPERITRAKALFSRHAMWAVFVGRFIALLRILAGPLAGSMHMPYGKFLVANVSGGIVWAGGTTAAIYYLGIVAEKWLARFAWVGLVVAVLVGLLTIIIVRKRSTKLHT